MNLKRSPVLLFTVAALTWFVVRADAPSFAWRARALLNTSTH